MPETLADFLEPGEPERLATSFVFTEGPLWHPHGFWHFVDVRVSRQYKLSPGGQAELIRENTGGANGMTFDLQGRLVICEGEGRRIVRMAPNGGHGVLVERTSVYTFRLKTPGFFHFWFGKRATA